MSYRTVNYEAYIGPNRLFVEGSRPEMETGKPSVLFVGGAFDGSWICRQQLDCWAARGYPSYAVNLRGYYKSVWRPVAGLTARDYLDDILAARDHLELDPVILAGYSMGGLLVQKFAELYGARALILYDPDPPRQIAVEGAEDPDLKPTVAPVLNFWPTLEIAKEMMGAEVSQSEFYALLEYFKRSFLSGKAYRELEIERLEVDARKVACPVLMLGISASDPVQAALARYLGASRLIFTGYSHGSILISRYHKPITRRVLEWMEAGFPRGRVRSFRLKDVWDESEKGQNNMKLKYFTGWKEPQVHVCNRRGQELYRKGMKRVKRGRSPEESVFQAKLQLDPGEQFFLSGQGRQDRPYPLGFYAPAAGSVYLMDGEFFPLPPPPLREKPIYLTREIYSRVFDHHFRINLMLPRDYGRGERGPYPLAVLNDGQNQWKNQGAYGGWHTDAIAWDRARRGRCRDVVLVSIVSHSRRDSSYLPPPRGIANEYVEFVADTVLPVLRDEFKLSEKPHEVGMIGASYAANCAVYAGLARPEVFGVVGSFSYAFIQNDPVHQELLNARALPFRRLYLDCGTRWAFDQPERDDNTGLTRDLIRIARGKGMAPGKNLLGIIAEGHYHCESFWRQRVGRCLEFLYPLP